MSQRSTFPALLRAGLCAAALTAFLPGAAQAQFSKLFDGSLFDGEMVTGSLPATNPATAEYRRKLAIYKEARAAFDAQAGGYWNSVSEKRKLRFAKRRNHEAVTLADYVLTQPPRYSGPARPVDPDAEIDDTPRQRKEIPVAADFLRAAATHYKFAPQRPASEIEYKRAYAKAASAAGLTREQIVRIYSFESGGNGRYDVQAGLEYARPNARAISTALGYNQLLTTNTVSLMAEHGDALLKALHAKANALAEPRRSALKRKIVTVQHMIQFARTVPRAWSEHQKLANTDKGMALHVMNLDIDVGPLLQTQKLLDSLRFARLKGHMAPLTAAELEMMNLTGDGNGIDMVMMPQAMRERVPTSNFFQRGGYERNPVAIRNNTVATLIAATNAKMDQETKLPGARELASAF